MVQEKVTEKINVLACLAQSLASHRATLWLICANENVPIHFSH